jgi:enoyl-CoA hydratase
MSEAAEILFERRGAAGLVMLNRPKALNAVTHTMVKALRAQLEDWARDTAPSRPAGTCATSTSWARSAARKRR